MKSLFLCLLVTGLALAAARANETVRAVQQRLATEGSYRGEATGTYDSETAAAVTRYQIRKGLTISGKLDAATLQALGVSSPSPTEPATEPSPASGTWRRLRDGDMQFLKNLNSGAVAPPKKPVDMPRPTSPTPPGRATLTPKNTVEPHGPPPPLPEDAQGNAVPHQRAPQQDDDERFGTDRLGDYVGAFVLAGLDPAVGAELEFFADRVDYFGEKGVRRPRIRRDLVRYDQKWPHREFSIAGKITVERLADDRLKVAFPLRYQLSNGSRHAAGKVWKTLVLQKADSGSLEIISVNERKM